MLPDRPDQDDADIATVDLDLSRVTIVDRIAARRLTAALAVASVAVVVVATAIALVCAYSRIAVLEDDLRQRRSYRDSQHEQLREAFCVLADGKNEARVVELQRWYACPADPGTRN
ncbi:hypothetical protein [Actinoplanes sp. NBRC 101535]|uniref:hypothetical protein n=1 Tax=Actinoplanes sp. NBRC 101535 TaxID=3032196 RepID=UPI0024A31B33|nr:hypothetical protein [Actinoplanes sp. NBRC 101535]GLY08207.1 hypothetical protein Acsp01_85860 [Actinoplanes sp. NBRC 101535]